MGVEASGAGLGGSCQALCGAAIATTASGHEQLLQLEAVQSNTVALVGALILMLVTFGLLGIFLLLLLFLLHGLLLNLFLLL